ncbi:MAG: hypothetical protein K2J05_07770, partial [Muribaculaceae bacterium]|nr:hypothetical protein [Muribaculaceae bacterium]
KAVAPKYAAPLSRGSVEIVEHDIKPSVKVRKVIWTGADFDHFDHTLAKDMQSFFDIAGSPEAFKHDCDGVILFERNGKKYMFLTELKSNFDTEKLYEAKTQIVSSFLKTNMLLHLSLCYKLEDYIIKGFIVGRPPKSDFKIDLYKGSMLSEKRKEREYDLAKRLCILSRNNSILLKPYDIYCLRGLPLGQRGIFPNIELHFIEVPEPYREITLDVGNFI